MESISLTVPRTRFSAMLKGSLTALLAPLLLLGSSVPGATAVGCVGIVFLLVAAGYFAMRLRSSAPMLVIDDTGLTDNATLLNAGFLLWADIARVEISAAPLGLPMLSIHLTDTAQFYARVNPVKRALMRISAMFAGGAPVNLPLQALSMDGDALLAAIRARLPARTA